MNFWLRKLIFGVILGGIAFGVLNNLEFLLSLDETFFLGSDSEQVTAAENAQAATKLAEQNKNPQRTKKKEEYKNAAAEGLSRFYASINAKSDGKGPKIRNGVVFLPEPHGSLSKLMEARRMVTRPLPRKWHGQKKSQAFRKGHTLFQKLSKYANDDGLEVIWRLNRDLVVKDAFRINKSILKMAYQVGQALNGHFKGGVSTYFCYKHRAIVLIEYSDEYLEKQCILLKS